jgi:UDP-GlcNAc:undecaprenyl-phosphate GlcNAc-1-phosphate transferase
MFNHELEKEIMINILIIYTIVSFLLLFLISKLSYKLNLVDKPSKRKIHSRPVAFTGGLIISFLYIFSIYLFDNNDLSLIISIALLIAIVGFIDDIFYLNIVNKLSLQIIPIFYLIIINDFNLVSIGYYGFFKLNLNSFSIPFTLLAVAFLINSFNYFDGLDGTLGFTSISVIAILYFLTFNKNFELYLIILLIPLLAFLFFNFSIFNLPKLFLGDSGSLLLGFVIAFTLIYISNQNIVHPILLAWSVVIFVYEFLSVNLIRIQTKKNIFNAGFDHLHHIIFKKNKSIFLTNFLISITNIILFIIGYLSFKIINPFTSLILFICFFIIFYTLRKKSLKQS